jgi:hypothetical protein
MAFHIHKRDIGGVPEEYCGLEMVVSTLHNLAEWLLETVINIFIA